MTSFLYQPPRADRKIKSMVGRSPNRKTDDSVGHLSKGGLPVNPQVLKAIKEKLATGAFHKHPQELLEAVKSDPGMFMHVARQMRSLSEDVREGIDPLQQLKTLEDEKLQKLFAGSEREISTHRLRDATPAQLLRYQHAVISTRAAEALAPTVSLSPDLAFSGAALRQLGHSLLSWNYPEIYARALLHQRSKGASLELELKKLLGLTPAEVGARYAAEWNLSPELRWAVAPNPDKAPSNANAAALQHSEDHLSLRDVFDLSELFAKANDPQHYPDAPEKWSKAEENIQLTLGVDLPALVRPSVESSLLALEQSTAHPIHTPFFEKAAPAGTLTPQQEALMAQNQYLKRCDEAARSEFNKVYQHIAPAGVSVNALRLLVDHAIPVMGFLRGCLYLLKKESGALRPALRIGDKPLDAYRTYREGESNPIAGSLGTNIMLKQQGRQSDGSEALHLFGSVFNEDHPGVLHLEVSPDRIEDPLHDSSLLFNAIRKTIGQCLGTKASA